MVTVTLKDRSTGKVVEKDGVVQFQATRGGLGQTTSALQKGKATVQLTSVAAATSMTSIVTATVSDVPGAAEFEGLTAQKAVVFSPDAVAAETKFVQALKAESTQGDRLHVSFSDKISAADYKKAIADAAAIKGKPTSLEYKINVDGKPVAVKDVVQLTDNTLEFILDVDSATGAGHKRIEAGWAGVTAGGQNYLRDNVTHTVTFPQNIGGLVLATTTGINFILTDTSRPAVLGVTAQDQLNFTVRLTESVDESTVEVADKAIAPNFLLDGRKVRVIAKPTAGDISAAKANNEIILTSLKTGEYTFDKDGKATDARNLVNFVVHKDFALAGGVHQIQIANVGDWAQDVDPKQNLVATDTFDFTVSVDSSVPVPTVEVQSPEQWKVSFDKAVYGSTGKTVKDVFAVKSADSNDTFEMDTDYIVSYIEADGTVGKKLNKNDAASELDGNKHFLIEFTADWTKKYDTDSNALKTYFASTKNPYTVTVQNLESAIGNKMSKQDLDVKLSYDGVSPTIATAKQLEVNGALTSDVRVNMSEPVKNVIAASNNEGLTPSQQQDLNSGVPVPTYEFVKGDKVVKATAKDASYDNYGFTLTPATELEAGEWTLYIRSISDDIGNTSATVSQKVTIVKAAQAATTTQVAWAAFDDEAGTGKLVPGTNNDPDNDVIYVKFTKVMKADGANGVSRTQNYVFKGQPLPAGSQVVKGINGVTNDWDGVTILMPKGSWDGVGNSKVDFGAAFNVANNFVSADGEALSGAYEVELKDTTNALNAGFEGLYKAANSGTFGNVQATIKGAEAKDVNANGKADQIKLTFEESVTLNDKTEIRVNGKTFVISGNTVGTSAIFNAKDANNEVDGTTTNGLVITSVDGAILVNKESVVDKVAPVVKSAEVNAAGDRIKITFSEKIASGVYADTNFVEQNGTASTTGALTGGNAIEVGDDYLVYAVTTPFVAGNTIDIAGAGVTITDLKGNSAVAIDGATMTNDVKITGIATTPGSTVSGVTATSASTIKAGVLAVAGAPSSAADIGASKFGGFSDTSLAGYTIEFKNDGSAAGDAGAATANATLDEANKKIVVVGSFAATAKPSAANIQAAIRGLKAGFDALGKTAQGTEVNKITVTNDSTVVGTSVISGGTTAVTGEFAQAKFKVQTGATKTASVTVKITVKDGATSTDYTATIAAVAGESTTAIAGKINGVAFKDASNNAAPFSVANNGDELTITQTGTEKPVTYTVSVQ